MSSLLAGADRRRGRSSHDFAAREEGDGDSRKLHVGPDSVVGLNPLGMVRWIWRRWWERSKS